MDMPKIGKYNTVDEDPFGSFRDKSIVIVTSSGHFYGIYRGKLKKGPLVLNPSLKPIFNDEGFPTFKMEEGDTLITSPDFTGAVVREVDKEYINKYISNSLQEQIMDRREKIAKDLENIAKITDLEDRVEMINKSKNVIPINKYVRLLN